MSLWKNVQADKSHVQLRAGQESSDEVTISSKMPGSISFNWETGRMMFAPFTVCCFMSSNSSAVKAPGFFRTRSNKDLRRVGLHSVGDYFSVGLWFSVSN